MRTTNPLILTAVSLSVLAIGCRNDQRETVAADAREIRVPEGDGRPVMTDGMFQPGEWDDVTTVRISPRMSLFFKRYQGHLYLGADARQVVSPSVDLFFASDSTRILALHRSAQLGEMVLTAGAPDSTDPEWVWGRTSGWYSNEGRWTYRMQDSLMAAGMSWNDAFRIAGFPCEIAEFDILTSKLGTSRVLFRIAIESGDGSVVEFPAGTSRKNPAGWATLLLE